MSPTGIRGFWLQTRLGLLLVVLAGGILCIAAHGVWVNRKPVIPITGGPNNAGDVLALGSNPWLCSQCQRQSVGEASWGTDAVGWNLESKLQRNGVHLQEHSLIAFT